MRNNQEYTPLSVWITMVSILVIGASVFTFFGESIRTSVISNQIEKITKDSSCNSSKIKVFAFGSSMFRTGIANRFEIQNLIPDSSNYCLERVGYLNLTLSSLIRNKQVAKSITDTNADIILIESAFLRYKSRSEQKLLEGRPRHTIRMLKQHYNAKNKFAMDKYPKPFYNGQLLKAKADLEAEKALINRKLRDQIEITKFLGMLRKQAPNAKIIIVDVPRPGVIQEALYQRDQAALIDYKEIGIALGFDYWEWTELLENELFFDVIHLNKDGQKVYMEWLLGKIEKEISH